MLQLLCGLQTSVSEHCVVESKPDNAPEDLRLGQPWAALQAFAHSFELPSLDDVTRRHLPYGAPALARTSMFKPLYIRLAILR